MTPSKILDSGSRAHVTHHSGMHPLRDSNGLMTKESFESVMQRIAMGLK